jgi:hypothetical protein
MVVEHTEPPAGGCCQHIVHSLGVAETIARLNVGIGVSGKGEVDVLIALQLVYLP